MKIRDKEQKDIMKESVYNHLEKLVSLKLSWTNQMLSLHHGVWKNVVGLPLDEQRTRDVCDVFILDEIDGQIPIKILPKSWKFSNEYTIDGYIDQNKITLKSIP